MKKKILLTVLISILVTSNASALELITNYTRVNDGLVSDVITSISMDPSGSVWVGTNLGLSRFDGIEWKSYRKSNSDLPSEYINCIMPDSDGNIYFGTELGIAIFDSPKWKSVSSVEFPSPVIEHMFLDEYDDIWLATGGGLAKYHNDSVVETFTISNSDIPDDFVKQIELDSCGYFWLATAHGVSRFDRHNFVNYNATGHNLPDNYINSIAVEALTEAESCDTADDIIWIATDDGVGRKYNDLWEIIVPSITGETLLDRVVKYVIVDYDNNKWFATASGVSELKNDLSWESYTEQIGLVDDTCNTLALDNSGNIWVGTDAGLSKIGSNAVVSFDKILYLNETTKARITVNDPNHNLDDTIIDTIFVKVFSDSDPEGITLEVSETNENSGIFSTLSDEVKLNFTYNLSNQSQRMLHVTKGDGIYASYTESDLLTTRVASSHYNEVIPFTDSVFLDLPCFIATASYVEKSAERTFLNRIVELIKVLQK